MPLNLSWPEDPQRSEATAMPVPLEMAEGTSWPFHPGTSHHADSCVASDSSVYYCLSKVSCGVDMAGGFKDGQLSEYGSGSWEISWKQAQENCLFFLNIPAGPFLSVRCFF